MSAPFQLSNEYWNSLSANDRALYLRIRPHPTSQYAADVFISELERYLAGLQKDAMQQGGQLELVPDFQRGHVWTEVQQIAYVEAMIAGRVTCRIMLNGPGFNSLQLGKPEGDIHPHLMQCIDGLQRLTAVRRFMAGEFTVFGDLHAADLVGTPFDPRRIRVRFEIFGFARRAELLEFYLQLNAGGTPHTDEELARVEHLLHEAGAGQ